MPPVVKRKGRPRGHELTAIGLPAKKAKKGSKNKPTRFLMLHTSDKERGRFYCRWPVFLLTDTIKSHIFF